MEYLVKFFKDDGYLEGQDATILAMDTEWAEQVLYLMLNTGVDIPKEHTSYIGPTLVQTNE